MFFNSTLSAFQAGFNPDSWVMYLMYGLIVAFVSFEAIYYLVKSIRRAKKIGMDMGKIKRVITTSATFSVLPAIGIGIGVVTLVGTIGIALPAIRLSVVGSLQYETQVADAAASAMAGSMAQLMQEGVTPKAFVTIAFTMTIAIIWGCLFVVLFYKRLQPKLTQLGKKDLSAAKSVNKFVDQKKINIGDLAFQIAFIGMIIAYLSMAISTVFGTTKLEDGSTFQNMYTTYGYYNLIAVVVAAGCMMGFDVLVNKLNWKWLDSFSTAFSMIIAMVVVAIIAYFAQVNGWDPTLTVAETVKSAALLI